MSGNPAGAELLWLETLHQVTARAAHELKGALNGVSVNLEVVRGRAAQSDQPAAAVARFAESAATQLDVVIEMNEALLALARRPRDPVDVAAVLRHLGALLVPAAQAVGTTVELSSVADGMPTGTVVGAVHVRTVLARVMLAMVERGGGGRVVLESDTDGVRLVVTPSAGALEIDARTAACARDGGITIDEGDSVLTLTLPAATTVATPVGATTHGMA